MKKIFTLLSLAVVAASAMAAPKVMDFSGRKLYVDTSKLNGITAQDMCKEMQEAKMANDPAVITRSFTDKNGVTWNLDMMFRFSWDELGIYEEKDENGNPIFLDFWSLPAYVVQTQVYGGAGKVDTDMVYWLSWPSKYLYYQLTGQDPNFDENDESTWDASPVDPAVLMDYEAYGVHKFEACSFLDPNVTSQADFVGGFPYNLNADKTAIESWPMIPMQTLFGDNVTCQYKGQKIICVSPTPNGYRSSIDFVSYDETNKDYTVADMVFYYATENGNKSSVRINYDGTALLKGYKQKTYDLGKMGELHVFNAGKYDEDMLMDLGYDNVEGVTLNRYFTFGTGEYLTAFCDDETIKEFTDKNVKIAWAADSPENMRIEDNVNYFFGYLYLGEKDTDFRLTTFRMIDVTYDEWNGQQVPVLVPGDGTMTPSAYSLEACDNDGFRFYIGGSGSYYNVDSFCQFGATNGFNLGLTDVAGDLWVASFDGEFIYHGDPEDMNKYEFRSLKGDEEPVTFAGVETVMGDNSQKLNVLVENGQIVAPAGSEIYDMSGRRVLGNGNGIYIVRNGKQAVKVLVK